MQNGDASCLAFGDKQIAVGGEAHSAQHRDQPGLECMNLKAGWDGEMRTGGLGNDGRDIGNRLGDHKRLHVIGGEPMQHARGVNAPGGIRRSPLRHVLRPGGRNKQGEKSQASRQKFVAVGMENIPVRARW